MSKDGEASAKPWMSHFWLVQQHDVHKDCNLELTWVYETVGEYNISLPILANKRQLKVGETLKRVRVECIAQAPTAKRQRA